MTSTFTARVVGAAFLFATLGFTATSQANAATLAPSAIVATSNGGFLGKITETGKAAATDGDINTGYLVTATPLNPSNVPVGSGQLWGFDIAFSFDVSGFSSISGVNFSLDGILNDSNGLNSMRVSAGPFSDFTTIAAPDGVLTDFDIAADTAGSGATALSNYLVGNTLTVFLQTGLYTCTVGSCRDISFDTREVSLSVDGTPIPPVPLPATVLLLLGALGAMGVARRRA